MPVGIAIQQQKDSMDKVLQALQMVQSGMGIKTAYDQIKLNGMKNDQYKADQAEKDRLNRGEFNEGEASNLVKVDEGTPGASIGYVDVNVRTPTGQLIYDPDSGEPQVVRQKFHYFNKENAASQDYLNRNERTMMMLGDARVEAAGGVPLSKLTSFSQVSFTPKNGLVKTWVNDPQKGRLDVWVSKDKADHKSTMPDWATSPKLIAGVAAAKEAGIANPTVDQAFNHSPENVRESVDKYKKQIETAGDNEFYGALENFDKKIGIGNGKQTIPGVFGSKAAAADIPLLGGMVGAVTLSDKEKENRSAVQSITNLLLQKRSGAAINAEEGARLAKELNATWQSGSPELLRDKIAQIRDTFKARLQNRMINMPKNARDIIQGTDGALHPESPLFKKKDEKQASDNFLKG